MEQSLNAYMPVMTATSIFDKANDARVLNSTTYTISVPYIKC